MTTFYTKYPLFLINCPSEKPYLIQNVHFFLIKSSNEIKSHSWVQFVIGLFSLIPSNLVRSIWISFVFNFLKLQKFLLRFQTFVEFLNKILEGPITYFTKVHDGEIWTALKNHFLNIQQNNTAKYQKSL